MQFIHSAIVCNSEDNIRKFYGDLLGLQKIKESIVPAAIINKISSKSEDVKVIIYGNDHLVMEIFLTDSSGSKRQELTHLCIAVENRNEFIEKCKQSKVEITTITKGEAILYFIKDYDNNLFEIKEIAA